MKTYMIETSEGKTAGTENADWYIIAEELSLSEARETLESLVNEREIYEEDWVQEWKPATVARDGDIIGGPLFRRAYRLTAED